MKRFLFALAFISAALGSAQEIQVNRQNKTIAVTAEDSTTADAEIAILAIGYHNFGATQDAAYQENVRVAERIMKGLKEAKVLKENIETDKLRLTRNNPGIDEKWTPEMKKERQFAAEQEWHVTIPAREAQSVVDIAVTAGANDVDDVDWEVSDPIALQAKASGAALAKARSVADQMARGLGTKLGELVYASNRAPVTKMWAGLPGAGGVAETVMVSAGKEKQAKLVLFPQKVKSEATVYAVFSIE